MNRQWSVLLLLAGIGGEAFGQGSEFSAGRAFYTQGEYKKAVAHFQQELRSNPTHAESYYWMGMSYQVLSDIASPFNGRYNSKARVSLTRAVELAPERSEYRRELFEFLLDSAASSRTSLRQAEGMLQATAESDPDYADMHRLFESERKADCSADARLGRLFLTVPRTAHRVVTAPVAAVVSRPGPELPAPVED